ncbi:MAG: efflux RND transporter periplasmic adaptor subunit [Acidobacteria bacterium]|jgi:RND family efflux transporter MFP subunit|nr:efflux RND transporter periplasmic adaptor subunit [Acidobacteriota bacterium]
MSSKTLKLVIPVIVLVVGVAAAALIASARKAPPRVERPALGPLVEVIEVKVADAPIIVTGHGEVAPRVTVDLVPQVPGQVIRVHPSVVAGGFFKKGEVLVTIDPRDYELAMERAEAAVARAKVNFDREKAEAEVAREEWDGLHPGEEPTGLVIREPQIRQAEAEYAAAVADLAVAELNLERTRLSLPFDGVVVSENVDVGQFVGVGSRLATVYGTDTVEVRVPLESRELAWFDVPSGNRSSGPRAEVSAELGGHEVVWDGTVTRMEAQVDQISRMVHVVVEVADPYEANVDHPPLLPGTFADVRIFGRTLANVVSLPRYAVREDNRVWVFENGTLEIRNVEVLRADRERSLVSAGLEDGDLVVVTALDAVTDGMKVRRASDGPAGGPA